MSFQPPTPHPHPHPRLFYLPPPPVPPPTPHMTYDCPSANEVTLKNMGETEYYQTMIKHNKEQWVSLSYMNRTESQITLKSSEIPLFDQPFVQDYIKENIKALLPPALCEGSYQWFPSQRASNKVNVSILMTSSCKGVPNSL